MNALWPQKVHTEEEPEICLRERATFLLGSPLLEVELDASHCLQ